MRNFMRFILWVVDKTLLLITAVAYCFGLIILLHHLGIETKNFWWIAVVPSLTTVVIECMIRLTTYLREENDATENS